MPTLIDKTKGRLRRTASKWCERRLYTMKNDQPIISFTFDDFPSNALHIAGACLEEHRIEATYYAALGLMGQQAPTGKIFEKEDIILLLDRGHELGCHTYGHRHAYDTSALEFEDSILRNRKGLADLGSSVRMKSLAYPISEPSPAVKQCCATHFLGCRAGGQTFNHGRIDLNAMRGYFLEQVGSDLDAVKHVIDATMQSGGWLILATHDVSESPTQYGCRAAFFRSVVQCVVASGARILPVSKALKEIGVRE